MTDLTLRRVEKKDIEIIRLWRNKDHVRTKLFCQDIITEDQQKSWFEKIEKDASSFYFVFSDRETDVGLIFVKNISLRERNAEIGIFVGNEEYLGNGVVIIRALLRINDFAFRLVDTLYCWIFVDNIPAIRVNESLGYRREEVKDKAARYVLTQERYKTAREYFESILHTW